MKNKKNKKEWYIPKWIQSYRFKMSSSKIVKVIEAEVNKRLVEYLTNFINYNYEKGEQSHPDFVRPSDEVINANITEFVKERPFSLEEKVVEKKRMGRPKKIEKETVVVAEAPLGANKVSEIHQQNANDLHLIGEQDEDEEEQMPKNKKEKAMKAAKEVKPPAKEKKEKAPAKEKAPEDGEVKKRRGRPPKNAVKAEDEKEKKPVPKKAAAKKGKKQQEEDEDQQQQQEEEEDEDSEEQQLQLQGLQQLQELQLLQKAAEEAAAAKKAEEEAAAAKKEAEAAAAAKKEAEEAAAAKKAAAAAKKAEAAAKKEKEEKAAAKKAKAEAAKKPEVAEVLTNHEEDDFEVAFENMKDEEGVSGEEEVEEYVKSSSNSPVPVQKPAVTEDIVNFTNKQSGLDYFIDKGQQLESEDEGVWYAVKNSTTRKLIGRSNLKRVELFDDSDDDEEDEEEDDEDEDDEEED